MPSKFTFKSVGFISINGKMAYFSHFLYFLGFVSNNKFLLDHTIILNNTFTFSVSTNSQQDICNANLFSQPFTVKVPFIKLI